MQIPDRMLSYQPEDEEDRISQGICQYHFSACVALWGGILRNRLTGRRPHRLIIRASSLGNTGKIVNKEGNGRRKLKGLRSAA